jgi:hypothetical protein
MVNIIGQMVQHIKVVLSKVTEMVMAFGVQKQVNSNTKVTIF